MFELMSNEEYWDLMVDCYVDDWAKESGWDEPEAYGMDSLGYPP